MNKDSWTLPVETLAANDARKQACLQKTEESGFWGRNDLIYIGDLSWTKTPQFVGYEFIADIRSRGESGFQYKYGLLGMENPQTVAQTMICEVRDRQIDPNGFEMLIGDDWQVGPLQMWLETLAPDIQMIAKSRYRDLVTWVRSKI